MAEPGIIILVSILIITNCCSFHALKKHKLIGIIFLMGAGALGIIGLLLDTGMLLMVTGIVFFLIGILILAAVSLKKTK